MIECEAAIAPPAEFVCLHPQYFWSWTILWDSSWEVEGEESKMDGLTL